MGVLNLPQINIGNLDDNGYAKKIANYLMMMNEQLRYMFNNLDEDNFSIVYNDNLSDMKKGIKSLVKDMEGNYSLILQTAKEIRLEVADGLGENKSLISQTATQIRSEVSQIVGVLDGKIVENTSLISQTATEIRSEVTSKFANYSTTIQMNSSISQTATQIRSEVSTSINGVKQDISVVEQTANKISWLVKSGTSASNFTLTDRAISLVAENINLTGYVTISALGAAGQTIVNGGNVTTGAIQSKNYVANSRGMRIDLDNGTIDSKGFKISSNGDASFSNGAVTINENDIIVTSTDGYLKAKWGSYIFNLIGFDGNNRIYIGNRGYGDATSYMYIYQRFINIGYSSSASYPTTININARDLNIDSYKIKNVCTELGFYGSTPVAKQTVNRVYPAAVSLENLATRFNAAMTALNALGLINASSQQ